MKIGEYPRMSSVEDTDVFVFSRPSDGTKSIRVEDLINAVAQSALPLISETLIEEITEAAAEQASSDILNRAYPVGSIYMSMNATSPAELFGGTWERIAQGRCLFGADDSTYLAGQTKNAGLPNITGYFNHARDYSDPTGAFYATYTGSTGAPGGDTGSHKWQGVQLDASRSSGVYGASSTVQPPALVVYMWKRTA